MKKLYLVLGVVAGALLVGPDARSEESFKIPYEAAMVISSAPYAQAMEQARAAAAAQGCDEIGYMKAFVDDESSEEGFAVRIELRAYRRNGNAPTDVVAIGEIRAGAKYDAPRGPRLEKVEFVAAQD